MAYITKTNMTSGPYLGSQMTQYAGMYALSKKTGAEIVFVKEFLSRVTHMELLDAFDLPTRIINSADATFSSYVLQNILMDSKVFLLDGSQNWDIGGWFHTFHYFHEYRTELMSVFTFKDAIRNEAQSRIDKIRNDEPYPLVSLHVRRGDYLRVASLNLELSYYSEALRLVMEKFSDAYFKLVVFSDDIEWCKQYIQGENVVYSENASKDVDMYAMSLCDHNIIANSSFSWWGAYLNKNPLKTVWCPSRYIGESDQVHQFLNHNYTPSEWTAIPV